MKLKPSILNDSGTSKFNFYPAQLKKCLDGLKIKTCSNKMSKKKMQKGNRYSIRGTSVCSG